MIREWLAATEPDAPNRTNSALVFAMIACLCGFIALVAVGTRLAVLPGGLLVLVGFAHGLRTRDHTDLG